MTGDYHEYMEMIDCDFASFTSRSSGALFRLTSGSKLLLANSVKGIRTITNCHVLEKGIIYVSEASFAGLNIDISHSDSDLSTALLYLEKGGSGYFRNASFSNNYAQSEGMIGLFGSSMFTCDYCEFRNNSV
eukprot:CAMPEP_0170545816 /NCGR_PEP_ID=MMETSP0211-20121228/4187_1 /TAXON_ID=311385 /ORGANISM="Pseudokeronopsis sp., Strain OXSARD2" /LENGTH=131 /DNA_ID=CAMNT_0010849939 /DNA_START=2068 /DNA_END=2463 /DNA_ORIENTATION=-